MKSRTIIAVSFLAGVFYLSALLSAGNAQEYLRGKVIERDPMETYERRQEQKSGDAHHYHNHGAPHSKFEGVQRAKQRFSIEESLEEHSDKLFHEDDFSSTLRKAQTGDGNAILKIAKAYEEGIDTAPNEAAALEWYKRAIDYGEVSAYSRIGDMYRNYQADSQQSFVGKIIDKVSNTDGFQKDNAIARSWYERGVVAGDIRSYSQLALMHRDGVGGLEPNAEREKFLKLRSQELKERSIAQSNSELHAAEMRASLAEAGIDLEYPDPTGVARQVDNIQYVPIGSINCSVISEQNVSNVAMVDLMVGISCQSDDEKELRNLPQNTVEYKTRLCNVERDIDKSRNQTHSLRCGVTRESIMIDGKACWGTEQANSSSTDGRTKVYKVECPRKEGDKQTTMQQVQHKQATCSIRSKPVTFSATYEYLLTCKMPEPKKAPTILIGNYSCSVSASGETSGRYSVNCGGLTTAQRFQENPQRLIFENKTCKVEAASGTSTGYDYILDCK